MGTHGEEGSSRRVASPCWCDRGGGLRSPHFRGRCPGLPLHRRPGTPLGENGSSRALPGRPCLRGPRSAVLEGGRVPEGSPSFFFFLLSFMDSVVLSSTWRTVTGR